MLSGLIQTIEKLQKKFIIKFTEDTMNIICNNDTNEGGIQVWSCVLDPSPLRTAQPNLLDRSRSPLYSVAIGFNPTPTTR
jgi:Hus1-like protein